MIAWLKEQFDLSGKRKLAKSTLYRQTKNGMAGESPLKMGPPPKIPPIFLEVLSTHAQICQVSDGKLKGKDIRRLIGASTVGSGFEDQFETGSVWRKLIATHPESLQAVKRASVEDARAMSDYTQQPRPVVQRCQKGSPLVWAVS